jgi:hypothetical protein
VWWESEALQRVTDFDASYFPLFLLFLLFLKPTLFLKPHLSTPTKPSNKHTSPIASKLKE